MFITPLYAAAFGLLYVFLALNVIRLRFRYRIGYGEGEHGDLIKAVRAHANFGEYVPMALILMWIVESMTFSSVLVFWLGAALLVARVLHVFGMLYPKSMLICRQVGMVVTLAVIVIASVQLLTFYLPASI